MDQRFMRLRESFWAFLGRETSNTSYKVIEAIRTAMLHALDTYCYGDHYTLDMKISFAQDVAELWYLRPDLMATISASHGERIAHQAMVDVTAMFKGHHPRARSARMGLQ